MLLAGLDHNAAIHSEYSGNAACMPVWQSVVCLFVSPKCPALLGSFADRNVWNIPADRQYRAIKLADPAFIIKLLERLSTAAIYLLMVELKLS